MRIFRKGTIDNTPILEITQTKQIYPVSLT